MNDQNLQSLTQDELTSSLNPLEDPTVFDHPEVTTAQDHLTDWVRTDEWYRIATKHSRQGDTNHLYHDTKQKGKESV